MAYILTVAYKKCSSTMEDLADPRVSNWFLMDSLATILLIDAAYVYGVKVIGPKLMEKRKPFDIDKLLIAYNFFQMLINAYILYSVGEVLLRTFNFYCNPVDYSNDRDAITLLSGIYLYFLTKLLDLSDTVFFVLRKKDKQVTFLHVYHHSIMFLITWAITKFYGGGSSAILPFLNSFVHVCMYGYYLLSVINKDLRNNISVKKRITELQLVQFVIGCVLSSIMLSAKDCQYPKHMCFFSFLQTIFGMFLFGDFYIRSYIRKRKSDPIRGFGCLNVANQDSKLS